MKILLTLMSLGFAACTTAHAETKPLHIERWKTSQGTPVVFYQAMEIPMLDISLAFRAGTAYDGPRFGLSTLTTRLMNQGNAGLDANTIATRLEDTGAQYNNENNRDMVRLHLRTLTSPELLKQAVDTFSLMASRPDFPEKAFEREKNQQRMAIRHALESPDDIANQTFFQALYQNHPYAHPVNGELKTLDAITVEDVRRFHHTLFVSKNATIVLVGALDTAQAKKLAEQLTQQLPQGKAAPHVKATKALTEAMDINVPFPSSQTVLRLGQLGITHHDAHYFPLVVGNYTLGGGSLVSRLAEELREKRGLTYGVSSQFLPLPKRGPFIIGLATQGAQAKTAETLTRETLSQFIKTGPSDVELKAAQEYLVGSFPLSLATNQSMASILLKMTFYQLPDDYLDTYTDKIRAVDAGQIKTAFQKSIQPQRLLQVMVGKV
ncbi:MAG: pitrilysin family protein [Legionellaceae bacterium]|nr:pitrilysin family protein [Legionellaceae bacterium]